MIVCVLCTCALVCDLRYVCYVCVMSISIESISCIYTYSDYNDGDAMKITITDPKTLRSALRDMTKEGRITQQEKYVLYYYIADMMWHDTVIAVYDMVLNDVHGYDMTQ